VQRSPSYGQLICQRAAKGEARPEARWYSAAGEQLESDWTGGDVEELENGHLARKELFNEIA
jgi:hypothetical protein